MSLRDSLPLLHQPPQSPYPPWVAPVLPAPTGTVLSTRLWAAYEITVGCAPVRAKARDVVSLKARKFVDLLKSGVKPGKAAYSLHTTVKSLMDKPQTQKFITDLVEGYTWDAKLRAMVVRAELNKRLVEASAKDDVETVLAVTRQMADDTELGLKVPTVTTVHIGLDPVLKDLLDRTVPMRLENIIDVTPENLPGLPEPSTTD